MRVGGGLELAEYAVSSFAKDHMDSIGVLAEHDHFDRRPVAGAERDRLPFSRSVLSGGRVGERARRNHQGFIE